MNNDTSSTDASKGNGADKDHLNGAGIAAVSAALSPAAPTPAAPARSPMSRAATSERFLLAERDAAPASPAFEGYGRFSQTATAQPGDAKLEATTRMVNAFVGYLTNACGRTADQMTAADVAALGQLLGTVERLEVAPTKRSGH
jgi:hypothetical protein